MYWYKNAHLEPGTKIEDNMAQIWEHGIYITWVHENMMEMEIQGMEPFPHMWFLHVLKLLAMSIRVYVEKKVSDILCQQIFMGDTELSNMGSYVGLSWNVKFSSGNKTWPFLRRVHDLFKGVCYRQVEKGEATRGEGSVDGRGGCLRGAVSKCFPIISSKQRWPQMMQYGHWPPSCQTRANMHDTSADMDTVTYINGLLLYQGYHGER